MELQYKKILFSIFAALQLFSVSSNSFFRIRFLPFITTCLPTFRSRPNGKYQYTCSDPVNQGKTNLVDRVLSFRNWPNTHLASPKLFSEAGFFYLGSDDKVKCFNCGGGLGGWRPKEDPFYEHAKWFPE